MILVKRNGRVLVEVKCNECDNKLLKRKSELIQHPKSFCSKTCKDRGLIKPAELKTCICGKGFYPNEARQTYCSISCGAVASNKRRIKKEWKSEKLRERRSKFCECGKSMYYKSERCLDCDRKKKCLNWLDKTLFEMTRSDNNRLYKFNEVRTHARKMMKYFGGEYKCTYCDFNTCLHVDHKKGLSEFSPDTLMKEVNGLYNLRYLCPNHHTMVTKGLIE